MTDHVLVKITGPGRLPLRALNGDAGADLFVAEAVTIDPQSFVDVHSGIQISLPPGVWCEIVGRSSTLRKRGLLVIQGVIDNGYTGPLYAGVWNLTDQPVLVEAGERLAQLILHPLIERPFVEWFDELPTTARGSNGFGSTG